VAFELGRLLFGLHYFEQSLEFYQLSLDLFGFHHVTHHNQGLCNSSLNKYDAAAICFKKSLELKPDYEKAAIWLEKVKEAQISSLD
jgi:tetratricopeptide (TPR) repeat protein